MSGLVATLRVYLDEYGYLAVFGGLFLENLGIPMPGQTLLILAAFYSSRGDLDIVAVLMVGWAASFIGSLLGYAIGLYGGRRLILRYGRYIFLDARRLDAVEEFFRKHGKLIGLLARFLDGTRQLNGVVSGIASMPLSRFVSYNLAGAAVWVFFWGILTYKLGEDITHFGDIFKNKEFYILLAVVLAAAVIALILFRRARKP